MSLKTACDTALAGVTGDALRVPGVVAAVTDRERDIYAGVTGNRRMGDSAPMTLDTVFAIFSMAKAITGTVALQCVEEGLLDLDAPAKEYAPAIGRIQVLEGFRDDGSPRLRAPKSDVTTRQLLLHTAGFGYDFFNENYKRMADEHGQPSVITATRASIETPLLFDPGEQWEYGTNLDWVGQVVEGIRGKRLRETMRECVFDPLDMKDIGFVRTEDMKARTAEVYARAADGSLITTGFELSENPEIDCGGYALYSTVPEYMKFIRMWLNQGSGPNGQVLKSETVAWATKNGLNTHQRVKMMPGVDLSLSNDAEFFPGLKKGWAYSFMTNEQPAPTGRPAGALAWAGLANLYYWIDPENGIGGVWATQIFPFADRIAVDGYLDFETAVYRNALPARAS